MELGASIIGCHWQQVNFTTIGTLFCSSVSLPLIGCEQSMLVRGIGFQPVEFRNDSRTETCRIAGYQFVNEPSARCNRGQSPGITGYFGIADASNVIPRPGSVGGSRLPSLNGTC